MDLCQTNVNYLFGKFLCDQGNKRYLPNIKRLRTKISTTNKG